MTTCTYCTLPTCIKCTCCDEYYCNNRGKSTVSHIIYHLTKSRHKSISLCGDELVCQKCGDANLFKLGYDNVMHNNISFADCDESTDTESEMNYLVIDNSKKETHENDDNIPCNNIIDNTINNESNENNDLVCGDTNNDANMNKTNNTRCEKINMSLIKNIICRDCHKETFYQTLVDERCLIPQLLYRPNLITSKINKTIDEDDTPLVSTKLKYTLEEYMNINGYLLTTECEQERLMKEELKQENVFVRIEKKSEKRYKNVCGETVDETNFYCCFSLKDADTKTKVGDEIVISNMGCVINAFIVQSFNCTDEIKARVYKIKGKVNEEEKFYTIEYVWKSAGMDRMIHALMNMHRMDEKILNYILGDFKSFTENENNDLTKFLNDKELDSNDKENLVYKFNDAKDTNLKYNNLYNDSTNNVKVNNHKEMNNAPYKTVLDPPNLPALNESQKKAVYAALKNPLTLIQGPPGTGKTSTSAAIVYNLVQEKQGKILVVANSNTAMDHLTEKIYRTGVKVLRIVSNRRENIGDKLTFMSLHEKVKMQLQNYIFDEEINEEDINSHFTNKYKAKKSVKAKLERMILDSADVVTCTCVSAGQRLFTKKTFHNVIIDEAVQCTEPLSIIPLIYGCRKLVLVGDHKQLGPIILNKSVEKAGFKRSLFERLVKLGMMPYLLNVQYRMHPSLAEWPSNTFYNGSLINGITAISRLNKTSLPFPTFFYVCYGKEELSSSGTSFLNQSEALYCESIIKNLIQNGIKEKQIGVITPYEGQRAFLLNRLKGYNIEEMEISNVDAFQGREKDFIIVSLVRSNTFQGIGFVKDERRLNVTLTRAKYGCVIIGNPTTLTKNKMWNNLIEFYQEKGCVFAGTVGDLRQVNVVKKKGVDLKALFEALDNE